MSDDIIRVILQDLVSRLNSDKSIKERFLDNLKAAGEDNCAKLVAQYINSQGFKATYVSPKDVGLLLTSEFGNAQILPVSYQNLRVLNSYEGIVIFPGFFGYSVNQEVVTLPRGGSDVTGAILAASLDSLMIFIDCELASERIFLFCSISSRDSIFSCSA